MQAKREYRDRDETEVAVLDALVDRTNGGMTVFELRSHVDAGIDDLEAALGSLKADDLIAAEEDGDRTVITVDECVVPDYDDPEEEPTWLDEILRKIGL
ncbi:hypothetical protein HALDL1_03285 [Halobacterium sp. DL1]|jgi:hypothetical protein|nr:hypothetical protein HALDL1_03285 [Halobacterium sp. DL1]